MGLRKVLAEVSLASLVVGAWVAGCYLLAGQGATPRTPWWATDAWGAWWVGPVAGAACLASGPLVSLSGGLAGDLPARVLLRTAVVLGSAASGLAVQALRGPQPTPRNFFLSYAPEAVGAPWIAAWLLTASSALVLFLLLRTRAGITRP